MYLFGIATKPVKKGPMVPVEAGLVTKAGLEGNYYGFLRNTVKRDRQITVLSLGSWCDALTELGINIPWYMRRANLCVDGYRFQPNDVGKTIRIGRAELCITGECDPCKRMDEVHPGLMEALTPAFRAGVTCYVISPGLIRTGDPLIITATERKDHVSRSGRPRNTPERT